MAKGNGSHVTTLLPEIETITPEKAVEYLETMTTNRDVKQWKINAFSSMLKGGRWRLTHQGIAFHRAGNLVDGQHRLWSIIETKSTVLMMVTRGLTDEDVAAIDTGLPRSYADYGHYSDGSTDPLTGSIAKYLVLGAGNMISVPFDVMKNWYEHYKAAIDFALHLRNINRVSIGNKRISVPMTAAFARAYYTVNEEMLTRLGDVIRTGQVNVDADRAGITLRDAWLTKRLGVRPTEQYYKTEGAIRAFFQRRPIRTLQRVESELFDIPKLPVAMRFNLLQTDASPRSGKQARKAFKAKIAETE